MSMRVVAGADLYKGMVLEIPSPEGRVSAKLTGEECGHKIYTLQAAKTSSRKIRFAIPHPPSVRTGHLPPGGRYFAGERIPHVCSE